jgi:hypothetical protein
LKNVTWEFHLIQRLFKSYGGNSRNKTSRRRLSLKEVVMANSLAHTAEGAFASERTTPALQAYRILRFAFTVAPIVAGADKFLHLLTNWDQYLAPSIANLSPIGGHNLMLVIGVIEIVAGLIVALKPRIGSYIVAAWLFAIIIDLLLVPGYYDVALRDFGLALGALALGQLSREYDPVKKSR